MNVVLITRLLTKVTLIQNSNVCLLQLICWLLYSTF